MARIDFLNIQVDNLTMEQAVAEIEKLILKKSNAYVVTPNMDHIVMLEENAAFQAAYRDADLILTDGKPLIWISKYLGNPIVEKVSGSDLLPQVCALAAEKGYSLYILGAAEGVADKAAEKLIQTYPGLKIAGTYSPAYGFEKNKKEVAAIIQRIRQAQPDILAVSLGSPKGELFIHQHRFDMNVPVAMQIGASVDFIAGNVKRAPRWMSSCGLEWLYRTIQEPKRLAGRYFNDARKILPIIKKYKRGGKP